MKSSSSINILLTIGIGAVLLFVAGGVAVFWFLAKALALESRLLPATERALGYSVSTPYVNGVEVTRYSVKEDSYAYANGLRTGDILKKHPDDSYNNFLYRAIYDSQGGTVVFHVTRDKEVVKITFNDIPTIDAQCAAREKPNEVVSSLWGLRVLNWMIERAGGCPY